MSEKRALIDQLKLYIETNKGQRITPDELGEFIGMSRSQLHRQLKKITGQATSEFINQHKMNLAYKEIIESQIPIAEISFNYGYSDHSYFSKIFKKLFGRSPSETRNLYRIKGK